MRDVGVLGRAADYGGGASGSPGIKDDSNRLQISAAPAPVMAGVAPIVRGAPQDPGTVKISSTLTLALTLIYGLVSKNITKTLVASRSPASE